jgi:uncharacterized membrane protein
MNDEKLNELTGRFDELERLLREQIARIYRLEQKLGVEDLPVQLAPLSQLTAQPITPPSSQEAQRPSPPPAPPYPQGATGSVAAGNVQSAAASSAVPNAQPAFSSGAGIRAPQFSVPSVMRPSIDLEALIGGNWFNRIGILAIIFGTGFFLKYAFDNNWIGPQLRVIAGIIGGLVFLAGGEQFRKRGYKVYSQGLSGGGIAILYLSIFAAFSFYQLIPQVLAFAMMMVVTATAVLLAVRYDTLALAVLGLIGGLLTPILLSTGVDNQVGLFSYIAVLDAGVLATAYFKKWSSLNHLAFIGTVLMTVAWYANMYREEKLWTTFFFLTLFFVLFALLAVFYQLINARPTTYPDVSLAFANAMFYFGGSYLLLDEKYHRWMGLFALLLSAFYASFGYLAFGHRREDRSLIYLFLGLASLFLTLAIPIQLDQHWVTMGWAVEGAVLAWIGLRAGSFTTRIAGLVVQGVAIAHWMIVDAGVAPYFSEQNFTPVFNRRSMAAIVIAMALAATAWLYHRFGQAMDTQERHALASICGLGANAMILGLLSLDIVQYFDLSAWQLRNASGKPEEYWWSGEKGWDELQQFEQSKQFALTALWGLYGAGLLGAGIWRKKRLLRIAGLLLLVVTILKVFLYDLSSLDRIYRIISFMVLGVILLIVSFVYQKLMRSAEKENP